MAVQWLDLARYADSNGFQIDSSRQQYRWRGWVIDAFNRNLPFDQFTIVQLAGDLLPNATPEQIAATGFNRNHRLNGEGGRIVEEWFAETVIDRVETTGATWMALTLGCCRCHDHKFDPVIQKEFYQFFAFFNSIDAGGVLDGLVLDPDYTDAGWKGRLDGLQANLSGTGLASASYGYEPSTGRLQTVGDGVQTAAYAYKADSDLLWTTTMTRGGQPALKVERGYDTAGRQTFLETTRGAQMVERHEWGYDAAGQRERDTMGDGTKWNYGYDGRGEVTSGVRRTAYTANIVVPGHEYGYGFDAIGNRTTTTVNGRAATYTPNMRNQYEQRTVPGAVDVLGVALPGALVLANGVEAVRQGGNFAATVTVNNATAQHPSLNIKAVAPGSPGSPDVQAEDGGRVFISATPEIFTHDEDGNLTGDGRWTYEWDAEDRLRAMVTRTDLPATVPRLRLEFSYDARSRRIEKKVKTWNAGTTSYVLSQWIKYIYDEGWNLLAEVDGNNAVVRKYLWGLDLSQSRQGAGGVGGFLWKRAEARTI